MMRLPWVETMVVASSSSSVCWQYTAHPLQFIVFVVLYVSFMRLVLILILVLSAAVALRAMCLLVYLCALALVSSFSLILFCLTALEWRVVVHAHVVVIVVFSSFSAGLSSFSWLDVEHIQNFPGVLLVSCSRMFHIEPKDWNLFDVHNLMFEWNWTIRYIYVCIIDVGQW